MQSLKIALKRIELTFSWENKFYDKKFSHQILLQKK